MAEKRVLIIHPYDKTTVFLKRVKNHLINYFAENVHYFSVKPHDRSHQYCLDVISNHPSNGIVIFLGHGRSDKLYGSKGDLFENIKLVSEDVVSESPEKYYYNDNFIDQTNIDILKDKKFFCLACNSNAQLAQLALNAGVTSFLGFGDIPTSLHEFKEQGQAVSNHFIRLIKFEISYIIKTSLAHSIQYNKSFKETVYFIDFLTNQRIAIALTEKKWFKERFLLSEYLYSFKREIKIFGDEKIKVFS